ncbi:probable disease resistance protein At4g14610 [Citrus sinensis]|nr:probable disease resistance protein At4g14610 [Citrus sinensis]
MVESIVTVVLEFVKCLAPPIERRLGYLRNYNANFRNLKAEIDKLKDESRSIQHRVSEAERKGEKIEEKVKKWLVSANNTIEQAAKFIDDEVTTNKRCLMGLCPNLKTRYRLSKKAETEEKGLVELKEEAGKFDDRISYRLILEERWVKSNKDYEAFESRLSTLEAMQTALIDVNVSIIGVYGMGGIGKTTLVKEFARRAIEDKLCDMVVFSEVTQSPDIKKIQEEIAKKLGLELSEEAESRRASTLHERLKNENKILVILDNIWKPLDLGTIGIPFGVEHRGCKLLFTTRDLDVLLRMGSEKNFSIGILNEQEAWRLFKIMAGDYVENRELKSTATSVAKACGGLPIALTTVAKALRKKELPVWKNALQELQTPSEASFDEGVPAEAYSTIELSYKYLREGFFARKLERFKISIGNESFMASLPVAKDWFRSRSHFLINNNRESLRELKLKLDFTDVRSMKLQAINKVEYLWLDKLQGVKNVLFDLDTNGLPQLKLLWVQNNPDFFCIVDSMEMVACDAFPLLESLTLHNLINMQRICIDRLKVESFNKLKTIKVENCDELSNIFWLSTAKCLPRLERVAVINCSKMKEIFAIGGEADVDNNDATEKIELAQLRSLSLGNLPEVTTFFRKLKTPSASPNTQGLQEELTSSCSNEINLETLLFNDKVVLPNLEALEISEINVDKIWHYNHLPIMLPHFQSLTRLIVWHCHKLKYIFLASMIRSFEQLQQLDIVNCRGLQEIISEDRVDHVTPRFVFQRVTTLTLQDLPELRCLYPGMHTLEWPALKFLVVSGCDKLKIFGADLSQNNEVDQLGIPAQRPLFLFEKVLPNLEELSLSGKDMKMILQADFPQHIFGSLKRLKIVDDDSASFPIWKVLERFRNLELLFLDHCLYEDVFSKEGCLEKHVGKLAMIKCIRLGYLNHLKQLSEQDSKLDSIFQHLEILKVHYCQNLLSLLPSSSVSFRNLTKLVAVGCKELIHLVTSSTAKTLVRLVTVQVYGCRAMTDVVINDKEGVEKEEIVFSKLKALILCDLESLTSFCSANYTFKFLSLEYLEVIGCPKMKIFTTGESSTPPRVTVSYGESGNQQRWANNDLNTTIQQLHAEKLLAGSSSIQYN